MSQSCAVLRSILYGSGVKVMFFVVYETMYSWDVSMFFPTMDIALEDGKKLAKQSSRTGSGLPIAVPYTCNSRWYSTMSLSRNKVKTCRNRRTSSYTNDSYHRRNWD